MRVRRDISSVPAITATETWNKIVALITGDGTKDKGQLTAATGTLGSIITDELPARRAIIVEGVGPQLKIYCRYGQKATESDGNVDTLTWNPTAGDWTMHVPCDSADLNWVRNALAKSAPRIKVFDVDEEERGDDEASDFAEKAAITVDWNIKD